jgi:hypothetical protein
MSSADPSISDVQETHRYITRQRSLQLRRSQSENNLYQSLDNLHRLIKRQLKARSESTEILTLDVGFGVNALSKGTLVASERYERRRTYLPKARSTRDWAGLLGKTYTGQPRIKSDLNGPFLTLINAV